LRSKKGNLPRGGGKCGREREIKYAFWTIQRSEKLRPVKKFYLADLPKLMKQNPRVFEPFSSGSGESHVEKERSRRAAKRAHQGSQTTANENTEKAAIVGKKAGIATARGAGARGEGRLRKGGEKLQICPAPDDPARKKEETPTENVASVREIGSGSGWKPGLKKKTKGCGEPSLTRGGFQNPCTT